jgi:BON domain
VAKMGDKDLTVAVRKILVKNWVDIAKIRIRVTGGVAILTGTIAKTYAADDATVDPRFLAAIDHGLQTVKGLRRIRFQFSNWSKDGGEWVQPIA